MIRRCLLGALIVAAVIAAAWAASRPQREPPPVPRRRPSSAAPARSTPEEEARLLDAGFFDFIPKPINVVRLLARLKRALRHTYGQETPPSR